MKCLLEQLQGIIVALQLGVNGLQSLRTVYVGTLLLGPYFLHARVQVLDDPTIGCQIHCHVGQLSNTNTAMFAMVTTED